MAQQTQLKPNALPGGLYGSFAGKASVAYTSYGPTRVISDAVSRKLEVNFRATTGTVYARVYDVTGASAISASVVSTASATMDRILSSAFTCTAGNEHVIQFGKSGADAGEALSAVVVKA